MVTTPQVRKMTVEEFEQFVLLPENADKNLEFIGGRVVEMVSNSYCSIVAGIVIGRFRRYLDDVQNIGWITVTDGGYKVMGERYIPNVGFILKTKYPNAPRETYIQLPPDLAVEVLSPSDNENETRAKVVNYLRAGVIVWVVDPDKQIVQLFVPNEAPRTLGINDTLDGGTLLPGFTLPVKDIFPE